MSISGAFEAPNPTVKFAPQQRTANIRQVIVQKIEPKCLESKVPGFDILIKGKNNGGIPIGKPAFTLLQGNPGSGKSRLLYNITAFASMNNNPILYITFEKPAGIVAYQIIDMAKKLKLPLRCTEKSEELSVENITFVDFFGRDEGKNIISRMMQEIKGWVAETKGKVVLIDSITQMTSSSALPEADLRKYLGSFLNQLAQFCKDGHELGVLAASQYRGNSTTAGGVAMEHLSNAVLTIESEMVSNFNKRYYSQPIGMRVRKIWVEKTADFAHTPSECWFMIGDSGDVVIGDPISQTSEYCSICRERIEFEKEEYYQKGYTITHAKCREKVK